MRFFVNLVKNACLNIILFNLSFFLLFLFSPDQTSSLDHMYIYARIKHLQLLLKPAQG